VDNIERASEQLGPLLKSTHATSEKAGKLLAEIRPHELSATLDAVRKASSSLQQTSEQARPAMLKFRESLDEFERIARRIEQSSAALSNTIGTQTLPQTHQLLEQLQRDAETLNRLMESLEQNPQSMVFGKPRPAPGPGEKGYQP
jgi:phospholipid/cholesterol/gamma-HCH transport system substrate-binding protein